MRLLLLRDGATQQAVYHGSYGCLLTQRCGRTVSWNNTQCN